MHAINLRRILHKCDVQLEEILNDNSTGRMDNHTHLMKEYAKRFDAGADREKFKAKIGYMYTLLSRLEREGGKETAEAVEEFKERIQLFHSLIEEKEQPSTRKPLNAIRKTSYSSVHSKEKLVEAEMILKVQNIAQEERRNELLDNDFVAALGNNYISLLVQHDLNQLNKKPSISHQGHTTSYSPQLSTPSSSIPAHPLLMNDMVISPSISFSSSSSSNTSTNPVLRSSSATSSSSSSSPSTSSYALVTNAAYRKRNSFQRKELLGSLAEDELHHHQDEPDSNAVKAVLESEQKKQDEMFEELFRVGKQLKRGALNFDQALEEDKKVVKAAGDVIAVNTEKLVREADGLKKLIVRAQNMFCLNMGVVLFALITFMLMFIFIRIF